MDGNNQNNTDGYAQQQYGSYRQQDNPYAQQDNPYAQQDNPYAQQQYGGYGQQNNAYTQQSYSVNGQQLHPYDPKGQKKGAAKIIIAIACVLVVILAAVIGGMVYFRSTPAYKIAKGFQNLGKEITQVQNPLSEKIGMDDILSMMQEDGGHVETSLNLSAELPMVGTTTLGVDTDFYKDMKSKELNADTDISVMNYDFAHLNIYANDEVLCFSIPELFMEDMYIENENVVSQYNNSILADLGSPSSVEEFSIDLFPEEEEGRTSVREWKNLDKVLEQFGEDLDACKEGMTLEKAGKGVYRVVFPAKETNRLIKNFVNNYYELYQVADSLEDLNQYKNWVCSDVSILLEINDKNHIESIMFEEPVKMFDDISAINGEVFFLGENKSIDKIQTKISVDGFDGITREMLCQLVLDATKEDYQLNLDVKYTDQENNGKIKYAINCDAVKDEFDMTFSMKDDQDDFGLTLEGSLDDIVKGESLELDLEKAALHIDGEEVYTITGDVMIEPLRGKIEPTVQPNTAFFEMDMYDWSDIIRKVDDAYGSLLNGLW